ncbi:MAG TPA: hypothetical protein VGR45_14410, partial [Stellaceae bacterium]|nr:hypothetical protein [Stellaceae bacterium]
DSSLLFFARGRLLGVLPANRQGDIVYSHQGLTFGGVVADDKLTIARTLAVFDALRCYLGERGVGSLIYKAVPHIYHRRPADEDLYALFRNGAGLIRRDVATAIDYSAPRIPSEARRWGLRYAAKQGLAFGESGAWPEYWDLLTSVLAERHAIRPVHSLSEIMLLRGRFPQAIRLFTALSPAGSLLAGVVIFETPTVAHAQYAAASAEGRAARALDGLYTFVIDFYRSSKRWFDFGISTDCDGRVLNMGLAQQKEEFGGSSVVYDVYRVSIK